MLGSSCRSVWRHVHPELRLLQGPCMSTHRLGGKGQSACLRAFRALCLTFFVVFSINRKLYTCGYMKKALVFVLSLENIHTG